MNKNNVISEFYGKTKDLPYLPYYMADNTTRELMREQSGLSAGLTHIRTWLEEAKADVFSDEKSLMAFLDYVKDETFSHLPEDNDFRRGYELAFMHTENVIKTLISN